MWSRVFDIIAMCGCKQLLNASCLSKVSLRYYVDDGHATRCEDSAGDVSRVVAEGGGEVRGFVDPEDVYVDFVGGLLDRELVDEDSIGAAAGEIGTGGEDSAVGVMSLDMCV